VRHRPGGDLERVAVVPGRSQAVEDLLTLLEQPSQRLVPTQIDWPVRDLWIRFSTIWTRYACSALRAS
jgi:hypothetical protein